MNNVLNPLGSMNRRRVMVASLVNPVDYDNGVQGNGGWSYGTYTTQFGTTFSTSGFTYSAANHWWQGTDSFSTPIAGTGASISHPGFTTVLPGVRRWTATQAGTATVAGVSCKSDTTGGDGTLVRIRQNGTSIYSRTIAFDNGTPTAYSIPVTLAVGDTLDWTVEANGNANNDATIFTGTIQF